LLDAALLEQNLGEHALRLAQCPAVLDGGQDPDRLPELSLRLRQVALAPGDDPELVRELALDGGGARLDDDRERLLDQRLRLLEAAGVAEEVAARSECGGTGEQAAALLGQLERALDQRRRLAVLVAA